MTDSEKDNTDSQTLAFEENHFYRDNYYRVMRFLSLLIALGVVLAFILAWMSFDRPLPKNYAAITTGQVMPLHALSEPIFNTQFILRWSANIAQSVYNMSFDDYQNDLDKVKESFTSAGWEQMMTALQSVITTVTGNRVNISSVVSGAPVVLAEMEIHGRYTWRVQMPLLVTYTGASGSTQSHYVVTMSVQRVPTLNRAEGIRVIDFTSMSASETVAG